MLSFFAFEISPFIIESIPRNWNNEISIRYYQHNQGSERRSFLPVPIWSSSLSLNIFLVFDRPSSRPNSKTVVLVLTDQGTSWDEDLTPVPRNPEHNLQISDYIHINFFSKTKVETVLKNCYLTRRTLKVFWETFKTPYGPRNGSLNNYHVMKYI